MARDAECLLRTPDSDALDIGRRQHGDCVTGDHEPHITGNSHYQHGVVLGVRKPTLSCPRWAPSSVMVYFGRNLRQRPARMPRVWLHSIELPHPRRGTPTCDLQSPPRSGAKPVAVAKPNAAGFDEPRSASEPDSLDGGRLYAIPWHRGPRCRSEDQRVPAGGDVPWWRRRESNPRPKAFDNDVYMRIRVVAGTRARRRPSLFRPRGASTRRIAP